MIGDLFKKMLSSPPEDVERQQMARSRYIHDVETPFIKDVSIRAKISGTGLTPDDLKIGLNDLEKTAENSFIFKILDSWELDNPDHRGILLYGPPGRGKTTILRSFLSEMIHDTKNSFIKRMGEIKDDICEDFSTVWEKVDKYASADILIVDDIGAESMNQNVEEYLCTLFERRIRENRKTFGTSNLSPADMREKYNPRTFSRIFDLMVFTPFDGKCFRTEKNRKSQQLFSKMVKGDQKCSKR